MVYSVQEILYIWESYGVFDVVLPFLLVFAIVFGILSFMKIFGSNKPIHVVIALVIGALAVRNDFFIEFYKELFPRLGIGVTVILAVLILVGMFIPKSDKKYWAWGLGGLGAVIALIIIFQSFSELGWAQSAFLGSDNAVAWIIGAVLLLALIIAVATSGGGGNESTDKTKGEAILSALFGKNDD